MSVYVAWTLSAIRHKPKTAKIKSTFPADTRMIVVCNQLANRGAMLRWNPVTHELEAVPYRTPRR